ncbi:MAG: 4Fe-4S dicluster domain-containing protein, partial [Flavobacteriales bacterium]|nr:4Fe-4S dicluster domain-containing protein [Flavobacteriales bacterium]
QGDAGMATIKTAQGELTLPVMPVPGQKRNTVGVALGYGKGYEGDRLVGLNAFPYTTVSNGTICYANYSVDVVKAEGEYPLASSQTHHTMMGRKIVNETTIDVYKNGKDGYNEQMMLSDAYGEKKKPTDINLWADHPVETFGHRWGMAIDLNTCTGCSACVTACGSENNVPIVGRDEVKRNRTMFWMRIDRYFSSDMSKEVAEQSEGEVGAVEMYAKMEKPSMYPQVVHQPVMCQHCNHAPCETVCPVAATTHSSEGLNHMAYNRCVGTRYCANNCPYKVRRFNWFQYDTYRKFTGINPAQDDLGRMVLNPDVTVRSRGVMEKCSMCIQRIQAGKLEAKKQGEKVQDGAIQTACSSACPTNAITFGDINDNNHTVNTLSKDDRMYHLLEEVGTQPNIMYLTKVRNNNSKEA